MITYDIYGGKSGTDKNSYSVAWNTYIPKRATQCRSFGTSSNYENAVKAVVAPDVSMGFEKRMPNYIHPKITFATNEKIEVLSDSSVTQLVEYRPGRFREQSVPYYAINDTSRLDTLDFGVVDLPICNYDMNQARLSLTLTSGVNEANSTKYSAELWLDCIILDPVVE